MAFPNVSDIIATTIQSRTKKIADNVTNNNAILKKLSMSGRVKTISGGNQIYEELSFAENSNAGWYSGYDLLPVGVWASLKQLCLTLSLLHCTLTVRVQAVRKLQVWT